MATIKYAYLLRPTNYGYAECVSLTKKDIVSYLKDNGYWYSERLGYWISNKDPESYDKDYVIEKVELLTHNVVTTK